MDQFIIPATHCKSDGYINTKLLVIAGVMFVLVFVLVGKALWDCVNQLFCPLCWNDKPHRNDAC